ncbi:MAG: SpoIID/LytB domain-containing protein [Candidatus Neomarinimicrobiota bacterium]
MLTRGRIPSAEPRIRVGIVLPEDNFTTIAIEFPEPDLYAVHPSRCWIDSKEMRLTVQNGELSLGGLGVHKVEIKRTASSSNIGNPLVLKNVIAGRGFHWKKAIDVKLLGDLEIRVLDGIIMVVNELPLEQYLMCVATSEMSAACTGTLIKAQTIVARSWMLANIEQKHKALGFDVCNDDCCQRYHGTGFLTPHAIAGAQATRGQVIMYDDRICDARYSKSCGGMMETFEAVWDGPPLPYMKNIFDARSRFRWDRLPLTDEANLKHWVDGTPECFCSPLIVPEADLTRYIGGVDEAGKYFRWRFDYSQAEMTNLLNQKLDLSARAIDDIVPVRRGGSGRLIDLRIIYHDTAGKECSADIHSEYKIRQTFHPSFLYSSAFYVEKSGSADAAPDTFTLKGGGWGHGAGLCQIGALGMALKGYHTANILKHYYPGSRLVTIYS